ncbi:phosphomethylpyrimidine synthase ThiC [Syntrophomonas wolfei]|uniref:phosphomethylpyrimidine synthase ThiC n=2 Tax=Syntrophomonas wolfei TaxID=863 RepID=UPI0023F47E9E|nr:phosphomethylpyrimidine synthase ThiC [Syntrophomonas wolfei]
MNYKTQKEAARKGIVTPEMKKVAEKEGVELKYLQEGLAAGKIALPANRNHLSLQAAAIGAGLKTKINVNLGISRDCSNMAEEMRKVEKALEMQADAIMDLSCHGKTQEFRKALLAISPAMIGTVPVYDAMGFLEKELSEITVAEFLKVVETHARDGVDFMTIHAGIRRSTLERLRQAPRLTSIVSRGGALLCTWMERNKAENPFYQYFDEVLDICREYDVALSLGDACRPGSINDASDACQLEELITLGDLTLRAWEKEVQVIIEGPGHMPLNEIEANVLLQKKLCHSAPFYVLGPLVSDIAPGYDHITSAIGGAIAAAAGADFLCYVTPAEHLRLPSLEDMAEGIIAARIAAHAADIAKGLPGASEWDWQMSKARAELDWESMFKLAIDPEKARRYRAESSPELEDSCTMCGQSCALRNMKNL